MRINVVVTTTPNQTDLEDGKKVYPLADKIYTNLVGNQDYADSAIVLNYDIHDPDDIPIPEITTNENEINLIFGLEDCKDKEKALELLESSVKIIHDTLKEVILNGSDTES